MSDLHAFLTSLGNLHDCIVTQFTWTWGKKHKIEFDVEDLFWNFEGFPEYRGPAPGKIILEGVTAFKCDIEDLSGGLKIYDFTSQVTQSNGSIAAIAFSPAGRMSVHFDLATFPEFELPRSNP